MDKPSMTAFLMDIWREYKGRKGCKRVEHKHMQKG